MTDNIFHAILWTLGILFGGWALIEAICGMIAHYAGFCDYVGKWLDKRRKRRTVRGLDEWGYHERLAAHVPDMLKAFPFFVLIPGWVTSKGDGDVHYITSDQLARLYGLRVDEWRRWDAYRNYPRDTVFLTPRHDGVYERPTFDPYSPVEPGLSWDFIRAVAKRLHLSGHSRDIRMQVLLHMNGCRA